MQIYIFYFTLIIFWILNFLIVKSDFYKKIIPNKLLIWLIFLLPFYYFSIPLENLSFFKIFWFWVLSLFVSFIFYNLWVWSAWDAKYLFVLSLFLANLNILTFIWNIWFVTLWFLILNFLYLYLFKLLFKPKNWIKIYRDIYVELKHKFLIFIWKDKDNFNKKTVIFKILNYLFFFLIIFVSFRIFRFYFLEYFYTTDIYLEHKDFFKSYFLLIIAWFWIIFFLIYLLAKRIIWDLWNNYQTQNTLFKSILTVVLIWFLIYEYYIDKTLLINYLVKIFTIYIFIFLIVKTLIYMLKTAFIWNEQYFVEISDLQKWMILDKHYLKSIFENQDVLKNKKKYQNFFERISNPIENSHIKLILEITEIVNKYHIKNKTINYSPIQKIKALKTFAFGPYILFGFVFSMIFWNIIFEFIKNIILIIFWVK